MNTAHTVGFPLTRTTSRTQRWAHRFAMHLPQGIFLSHLTRRCAHSVQRSGTRWVARSSSMDGSLYSAVTQLGAD